MTVTEQQVVRPAIGELIALAKAVRPDWNPVSLEGALVMCHQRGWAWTHTLRQVTELLCDEKSGPRDLAAAARNPLKSDAPPKPETYERGLAAARAAMNHREETS